MSPLLSNAITITLVAYGLAMLLALWRMLRGPAAQDRVLALDLIYILGMLIALFGFVSSAAMAKFLLRGEVIE